MLIKIVYYTKNAKIWLLQWAYLVMHILNPLGSIGGLRARNWSITSPFLLLLMTTTFENYNCNITRFLWHWKRPKHAKYILYGKLGFHIWFLSGNIIFSLCVGRISPVIVTIRYDHLCTLLVYKIGYVHITHIYSRKTWLQGVP